MRIQEPLIGRRDSINEKRGFAMGTRRKGRELALQALYQIEITGDSSPGALKVFMSHFEGSARSREFANRLVSGVLAQREEIDHAIERSTDHWKLSRMAKVDLTILRLATFEILFCPDIPANVTMDEAIELGKRFGSGDSATFINGVLDPIAASVGAKSELR